MNFQSLRYYQAVQTEGSLQKAAEKLYISPQALSENMKRLEAEVGVRLFRQTRPITFSAEGERFGAFATEVLLQKRRMERDLAALSGQKTQLLLSTDLRGSIPALTETVQALSAQFPDFGVEVRELPEDTPAEVLSHYDFHISLHKPGPDMEQIRLLDERAAEHSGVEGYVYAAARTLLQSIWGAETEQHIREIQESRQLCALSEIPCIRFSGNGVTELLDQYLSQARFTPRIVAGAEDPELCFELCRSGIGACVIPADWLMPRKLSEETFFLLPLPEIHNACYVYLSYERGKAFSEVEQAFLRLFIETLGRRDVEEA